ncbi:MAG: hypothetical protein IRZ21_09205 [Thermoleophilaceae bacterium]|nr:hypothetical protein [Thermoleophilaceae bacterium]
MYSADSRTLLAARREAVLKRWLALEVERASLEELARTSLAERLRQLERMFDAALEELAHPPSEPAEPAPAEAIEEVLSDLAGTGRPLTVVVAEAPGADRGARAALAEDFEEGAAVLGSGAGRVVAILPNIGRSTAPALADRLRLRLWDLCGGGERMPETGIACYPDDGRRGDALLSVALERLGAARDLAGTATPPPSVATLHGPLPDGASAS